MGILKEAQSIEKKSLEKIKKDLKKEPDEIWHKTDAFILIAISFPVNLSSITAFNKVSKSLFGYQ